MIIDGSFHGTRTIGTTLEVDSAVNIGTGAITTTLAGTDIAIGSIVKSATRTVLVAFPVKSATLDETALALTATSYTSSPVGTPNGDNLDPSPTYDTDGVTPTVTTLSDLKVEQTAPITLNPASWMAAGALIAGTTLQYTVTVTNLGPSDDLTAGVVATLTDGADYSNLRYCVQLTITAISPFWLTAPAPPRKQQTRWVSWWVKSHHRLCSGCLPNQNPDPYSW